MADAGDSEAVRWHNLERQIDGTIAAAAIVSTYLVAAANDAKARGEEGRYAVYMDNANRVIQAHLGPVTRWYQDIPSGSSLELARERFCISIQSHEFASCLQLLMAVGLECKLLDQPMGLLHMMQEQAFGAFGVDGPVCVRRMRDSFDKKFQMLCRRIRNRA